jgi:hypothetical protein
MELFFFWMRATLYYFDVKEYSASRQIARSFAPLAIALVVGRVRHSLLIPRHARKTCDY